MSRDIDILRPHPVTGLLFSGEPAPHAMAAEMAARAALERYCDICGVANPSFGFGSFAGQRGLLACSDRDCLSQARRKAQDARDALAAPSAASSVHPASQPIPDLFAGVAA